jgi:enterochelin esterase-like enzyme
MPNRQAADQNYLWQGFLLFIVCLVAIQLVSCSPFPVQSTAQLPQVTPNLPSPTNSMVVPSPTETPIQSLTVKPATASPTPECTGWLGQVDEISLDTKRMYEPFKFRVYLPPCYALYSKQSFPVLYLFHGMFYSDDQWARLGVVEIASHLIASGEIPAFIIVLPYDPNAREPAKTPFDEIFIEEVVPYLDKNYRTIPEAPFREVGGLSRGSGWAIHFGLTHPDLFGVIGAHSPIIFWEDAPVIGKWLDSITRTDLPRLYLDIGEQDPNTDSVQLLEELLKDRNIPYEMHLNPGRHDEPYWRSQVENYIRWYAAGW